MANGSRTPTRDELGESLRLAAGTGEFEKAVALLREGADPNFANSESRATPLHAAAFRGYAKICQLLADAGADLNARDCQDMTPLHFAACSRSGLAAIKALAAAGADIEARTVEMRTPLHEAALRGVLDNARELVDLGADLLAKDMAGKTPKEGTIKSEMGAAVEAMLAAALLRRDMEKKIPKPGKPKERKSPSGRGV